MEIQGITFFTWTLLICTSVTTIYGQTDERIPEGAASLAFVFDITGSMYDDLVQVIEGAAKILATTLSRREKPLYNYVLVPFHDPDVGPVVVTTDPDDFQHELRNLYVQGGGDCPEMSITAIKEAIDVSLPNSFIYVFTDARSKDFYLTENVLSMIQKKQSQVVFVLTGDCDDPTHEGYLAYEQIASTSSGQVFLLKKSQVNEVLNFVRVAVQSRKVNLMAIDVETSSSQDYDIPVDSKLQEITISVSGLRPRISLTDPSGNKFTPRKGLKKLLDIKNALVVNVKDPQAGVWKMSVDSDDRHTIRVTGLSTSDFVAGFSRKPTQNMKETEHRPIGGISTYMLINATDLAPPAGFSQVELFDLYGTRLAQFPLTRDELEPNLYTLPSFVPPEVFFYVKVSGIDNQGFKIQRQTPTAITRVIPGLPNLWMPEVTKGYFGLTAVIQCSVDSLVPYTVRWYKEDIQQGPELYFLESANVSLQIPAANQFAEGIYFCNATNIAGSRKIPTFLDISEPPPSITVPVNVSVLPGENAVLTCNVFSTVDYNLTWHRPGYRERLQSSQKFVIYNNGSMIVRNVQLEDEGKYVCKAASEGGQSEQTAYIRVQVPPFVKVTPEKESFLSGQKKEITCLATGFPVPEIYWLRDRQLMIANERIWISDGTLTLLNLQQGDEGDYECRASNPAGEGSATAKLTYIERPRITMYESKVLVAAGDEAVLFCAAEGIPPPTINWYLGDVQLRQVSYLRLTDGQLKILGAQQVDAGQYRCEAVNEAGTDSAIVTLEVGSDPSIVEAPGSIGQDIGTNVTLTCAAEGNPKPKVFWRRKDGRKIDTAGRVKQLSSGALFIQNLDVNDEGAYVCVAQNQFGTTEASAYLSVTGIEPPLLAFMEPIIRVIQGESVELVCNVERGIPTPRVAWLRVGRVVQSDQYITKPKEGNIYIDNVQSFHADDYMCMASNVGGNASFVVTLQVLVPPSFNYSSPEDETIDFNILQGDRVILPCNVQGNPRPEIMWFKDGSPISLTDYHYFIGEDGSLEIYSVEAVDTGLYRCQAVNDAGKIEKVVNVFVQVPPTIIGEPNVELIVVENDTVTLPCVASGIPPPSIQWRKNFVPFAPSGDGYVFGSYGMTISQAKIGDKAIYECVAENVAGLETKVIVLVVQVPPVLVEEGNQEITVLKGQEVLLNCDSTGDPKPSVEWKKDEVVLSIFDAMNGFEELDSGSLLIESAKVDHSGRYVCIVKNDAGIATKDFVLTVQDPPTLPTNLTTYKEVIEKNPIILQCPATGTPPPLITWYKDGSLITGDQIDMILEDGSLQILSSEAEDSGRYKCVASNEAGKTEHEITIKVQVPPKLTGKDRGKEGVIDNPKVIVNENVTLTCPVEADPAPTIYWLKDGYELSQTALDGRYEISDDGYDLTIYLTEVADAGRYTCIAENVAGEAEKSFDLDVFVPPEIDSDTVSPEKNVVVKDNSLYLDCPVSGIPRPQVVWYKDGERLSPDLDPNLRLHADGRRLEILRARVSDGGEYTCVGENVAGKTKQEFDVDVQVPPKIDRPGEISKPEIVSNGTVELTCPASGIPLPEITWLRNNEPIVANTSRFVLLNDGWTLSIVSAQEADSARYTCRAKNPAGTGEKAFDLNVLVPPKIDRNSVVENPKVTVNQSTILNCPVDGKPSPVITWYKNGIRLDASKQLQYEILSEGRQLRIKKADLTDTATFQCVTENKAGSDSVNISLQVVVPPRVDKRRTNTNPKVVVGGNVTLTCPATGTPPPEIAWFKDGVELEEGGGISIDDGGRELTIYDAEVGDTGRYTCSASNEAGKADLSYQVDVQVPPVIKQDGLNPDPHVTLGSSIALNCPVEGIPKPHILWMKDGLPIDYGSSPHVTLEGDGERLLIQRAKLSDAATYTCVAANEAGSAEQEYNLDVWDAPSIDSSGADLEPTVIKGHNSILYCPVEGNPKPSIQWLKNGEPIALDNRVKALQDGSQLKIENATESDTGRYTCVARNPAGQDSLTYDLAVFVPPSIDESNVVYFRKVVENRTIIIECPVSGIPTPTVDWLIDGEPLTPREGLQFTHNNYHLEMDRAQVSDSAVYTCVASNAAGELKKKFDLEVQVPPRIDDSRLQKEVGVIQNRTQVIICPVTAIPQASIIWYKDGTPLLDWPYPGLSLSNQDQRLEVVNAQVEDAGIYTCQATNPAGQVKQDFTLTVFVPPQISGAEIVTTISENQGTSVTLECIATGIPTPHLAWIKDGVNIEISENPQISIQRNGRLLQITKTEVSDGGRYVCHAENRAGIAERLYDLQINVPAAIPGSTRVPQTVWVIMNMPLTLECPAEGYPPPVITWQRQGQFIQRYSNPNLRLLDGGRKLRIVSAQLLDLGDYICHVENVAGNASQEFFVNVYVPPSIEDGPEEIQAIVNTGAVLLCESLGLPDPVVTWEKDGAPFPTTGLRHRMRVSGTIEFTSVRLEDAGRYKCLATNAAGNATREMRLDVQVRPRMVGRQPLYLESVVGEEVVIPCEVEGTPTPRITWQKGPKVIVDAPGIRLLGNGSLYLERTSESDAGVYICIAQNSAGTAFGQIRLSIYIPPKIEVRETEFVINNAQNIVIPCRATGRPRPQITWEKDGVPITQSNAYVRILRAGLGIPFARPEESGTYTCVATNDAGSDRVDMKLLVQVPPQIGEASRLLTFTVGETAEIECAAIGIPPPTVAWLKEGRYIDTTSRKYDVSEFGTLIIRNLMEDDTGSYLCTATNIAGEATQERLVRIQVPPTFVTVPRIQEVLLDSRLELRCTANGIPTPTIYWKRNDVPIQAPSSVNGRSVYIVHNVRREDAGLYTCIAQNPAGQAEVNTMVTVKVPPEILTPPGNKAVTIAERVVLTCSVGGDPQPEVIWMKNGRPVRLSDRIQQLSNGSLVIYDSTSSDAGEYKCVATNDAGISEGVAMLTVREPPSFSIEPPSSVYVHHGDTLLIDCVGSGEPAPEMNWMIGWDILETEGRLSVLPNNSLRIVAVQLLDSNTYRCLASNNLGKTFVEVNVTVIVDGDWSAWSNWEECSTSCGQGRQLKQRLCNNPEPANHGRDCQGAPVEARKCEIKPCPVAGNWGNWLPWEQCSTSCGEGTHTRRRLCDNPAPQFGGTPCQGNGNVTEMCNEGPCSIDGLWGEWTSWRECSATCGRGVQERTRECDSPPPTHKGSFCQGRDFERKECKLQECPVDGIWGGWGHWTQCTLSCGGGTRSRARLCNNPEPKYGGLFCVGSDSQLDYCNSEPCPVHGGWTAWSDFGACSVSCNGGLRRRFRTCSNPAPSHDGQPCKGPEEDTETCNQVPCPVDGVWSEWSLWTGCSVSCDRGTKQRTRTCRPPRHDGTPCRGDDKQVMECLEKPCFAIPTVAEGKLIGYINNIDIPAATFTANMIPLPDNSATRVDAVLNNVPSILVPHFRHLISVLTPVYWTTAAEIDGAYNGYTLTDGDFTREVLVQYPTGEILQMSHYSKGIDHNGKLQLDIVVRGNVPDIKESQEVRVSPYNEEYTQSGPGSIHAQSTRLFHIDDFMLPYAWNHSIVYTNRKDVKMPYLVQKLYARNMEVEILPEREIVKFRLDTSISPGSPSNQCPVGFILNPEGPYCQDDDECTRLKPCSDFCHNSAGSFYCSCPIGFTLDSDGRQCLDVDECRTGVARCPDNQECTNTIGSFSCHVRCSRGLRPSADGQRCEDIGECTETPEVCSQICENTFGGYRCSCMPGYRRRSRGRCVDIDECELRDSPCEQVCANAQGSYVCSCRQGFELVSLGRCHDINECKLGIANCGEGQDCVNSLGSYRCVTLCPKGSEYIDGRCLDIDECSTGQHRCYYNQQCVNTDPGYRCECPRGYRSAGPGTPCLDIDECVEDPKICQHNCTNTIGSFECSCPPGYRVSRDKTTCQDINECIEHNIRCGPEKMCFNTLGEFTCIDIPCPTGYQRDPITNNCVLECIDAEIACPDNAPYADVIEFRTLALPSGVLAQQDLIRLTAYNQNDEILRKTVFKILENDRVVNFHIRLDDGIGTVFTPQPLEDSHLYKIKVQAKSFDNLKLNIQYQTTFLIHIAVSAYPY